jgi:hypothetical protein
MLGLLNSRSNAATRIRHEQENTQGNRPASETWVHREGSGAVRTALQGGAMIDVLLVVTIAAFPIGVAVLKYLGLIDTY